MIISVKYRFALITIVLVSLLCLRAECQSVPRQALRTVVIDAGHGGKDPGAVHGSVLEKNINLNIALALGKIFEQELPDVKVVFTRKTDVFVELIERGNIANKAGADLFISIHTDASTSPQACGNSTFVLGVNRSQSNLREVMRENEVITLEDDYTTKYEGFDPSSPESYIVFSLMQHVYLDKSMELAGLVQKQYATNNSLIRNRGTYQGGLVVLWKTAMPSILTEVGFISNDSDRNFLTSERGPQIVARSIFEAVCRYKKNIEENNSETQITNVKPVSSDATRSTVDAQKPDSVKNDSKQSSDGECGVRFYVQLLSSKIHINADDRQFRTYRGKTVERQINGWYKYYLGGYTTFAEARKVQTEARTSFPDAFVVAFDGKNPISVAEAQKRINN